MIVYKITNMLTGAAYVGITSRTLRHRWNEHLHAAKVRDTPLYRAIRKYGVASFVIEEIACARTYDALKEAEIYIIAQEGTHINNGGYNLTNGGDGTVGWVPSQETREKIRRATTAAMKDPARRAALSERARRQMADPAMRAIILRANKGRVHTEETRRKVSEAVKRRPPRSAETREKLAAALRGRPRPPEVRAKVAASKIGIKASVEARLKMSASHLGKPFSPLAISGRFKSERLRSDNKSGVKGVSWSERKQKWEVFIGMGGKTIYVGQFNDFAAACAARQCAVEKMMVKLCGA